MPRTASRQPAKKRASSKKASTRSSSTSAGGKRQKNAADANADSTDKKVDSGSVSAASPSKTVASRRSASPSVKNQKVAPPAASGTSKPAVPTEDHSGDDLLDFEKAYEQPGTIRPTGRDYRLGNFEDAPAWMQFNPFVRTGYRLRYTARMCFTSVFHIHNETGNVWTHLIGLIIFLILARSVYLTVLEPIFSHFVVFTLFMGACAMCMGCSCIYHLFNCHYNEKIAMRMLLLDLLGIACLITASFIPLLYFGFACLPEWRRVYLVMIGVLGSAGIVAPFVEMDESLAIYRTLLYVAITCSGLFPTAHITFGFPMGGPMLAPMGGVALMFLFYGLGLIFYLSKIPERWFPGHFDYWLNSHQIWHLFVLAAAVVHFFACVSLYQRYQHMGGEIC